LPANRMFCDVRPNLRTPHAAAALPVRAITESVLTLGWFDKDRELAEVIWMLDELRTRLSHHKERGTFHGTHHAARATSGRKRLGQACLGGFGGTLGSAAVRAPR